MPTRAARRYPLPGDFGVTAGTSPAMWLTRLGTFSRYGHAAVAVSGALLLADGVGVHIVEAHPKGARRRVAEVDEFVWSSCPLSDVQRTAVVADALRCVGVPYDWPAILGFVARFWGAKVRGQSGDHADDKMICSELVAWVYRRAGHEVARSGKIAAGDCSPGDLADHMTREVVG